MASQEKRQYRCWACMALFDSREELENHDRREHKPAPIESDPRRREAPVRN